MKIKERVGELIQDACNRRNKIILILKNQNGWYEGFIEKVYDQQVMKFITVVPGGTKSITGFLLVSDVLDVLY